MLYPSRGLRIHIIDLACPDRRWVLSEHLFDFAVLFYTLSTLKRFFAFSQRNLSSFLYYGQHLGDFLLVMEASLE